jgi:biopolymer transport protein ExbD
MPSVKIPRKSTFTDMTPFVDVAFLILSFFIMATKFKPQEAAAATPPSSVSSQDLPENDAILVTIDTTSKVFFSVLSDKDKTVYDQVIQTLNNNRKLNLTKEQMADYRKLSGLGVPFSALASFLGMSPADQAKVSQPGIPVLDTANNELVWWVEAAKEVYQNMGHPLKYLIKGDNNSTYPSFEAVIAAFKKNDVYKFNLVTALKDVPKNSELYKESMRTNSHAGPGK